MKRLFSILSILILCCTTTRLNSSALPFTTMSPLQTSLIPEKNKKIIDYVVKNGPSISSTYEKAVCTEMVIAVLKNFVKLSKEDKKRIRIITDKNIYVLRAKKSSIPKGIYYALTKNKMGIAIDKLEDVRPGDFVQFWEFYWGHCGIVKSIDPVHKTMELYSSTPMTNGYGILSFDVPDECYFVRLK
jgi:hypothetical protein